MLRGDKDGREPRRRPPSSQSATTATVMLRGDEDGREPRRRPPSSAPSATTTTVMLRGDVNGREPRRRPPSSATSATATTKMLCGNANSREPRRFDLASSNLRYSSPSTTNQVFTSLVQSQSRQRNALGHTAVEMYWRPRPSRRTMAIHHRQSPATSAGMKTLGVFAQRNTYWVFLYSYDCLLFDMLFASIVWFSSNVLL
jgi:hypothetical protein